jgi:hypothetical protein
LPLQKISMKYYARITGVGEFDLYNEVEIQEIMEEHNENNQDALRLFHFNEFSNLRAAKRYIRESLLADIGEIRGAIYFLSKMKGQNK